MFSKFSKLFKLTALAGVFLVGAGSVVACDNGPKFVDYAHKSNVKLTLDYTNRNFFTEGIGQFEVKTYIDGDTTHFTQVNGDTSTTLKARYYGIDTPESTGAIEEYGKQASNFTKEKLMNADANGTIVISSPFSVAADGSAGVYGEPETDSTGGRYLSLVWIHETKKNAPINELVLLNLWIVQEGLSWAKNTSEVPFYADTFSDAQKQAELFKLKLWSGEPDPLFTYGDYQTVSLLDIKRETELYLADPTYVNKYSGMKVRFTGVVSGYSNHTLYVQEYYPIDDLNPDLGGEWAGINVFCGMSAISTAYTQIGTYLEIVGTAVNSDTFGFQITDTQGKWPASLNPGEDDCKILLTAEENDGVHQLKTFEYTLDELNAETTDTDDHKFENLFCRTSITTDLRVNKAYVNLDGDEVTLYFDNADFNAYIPFNYHGNPDDAGDIWMTEDKFIGKTFKVSGVFAYHQTTSGKIKYQLVMCGDVDLVCTTPTLGTTIAEPYPVDEAVYSASSALEDVFYYVEGKISHVTTKTQFTISGEREDILVNLTTPSTEEDKIIVGSTVVLKGVPSVNNNQVTYTKASISALYLHGQTIADPLTTSEAIAIGEGLENGKYTSSSYFVKGTVKEITSNYDSEKRMSFIITFDGVDFLVTGSKMGKDASGEIIDYTTVAVGSDVIITARILNDNGTITTRANGCQVVNVVNK